MEQNTVFLKYYLKHEADLRAFIGAMVQDLDQREEVFQETVLAICEAFPLYNPDQPFKPWARGIARNKVLRMWAAENRKKRVFSSEGMAALDRAFEVADEAPFPQKDALRYCLENLPERSKYLLTLRYAEALKPAALAERMGRTLSAAHKALARIREGLKRCIERRLSLGGLSHGSK